MLASLETVVAPWSKFAGCCRLGVKVWSVLRKLVDNQWFLNLLDVIKCWVHDGFLEICMFQCQIGCLNVKLDVWTWNFRELEWIYAIFEFDVSDWRYIWTILNWNWKLYLYLNVKLDIWTWNFRKLEWIYAIFEIDVSNWRYMDYFKLKLKAIFVLECQIRYLNLKF
jgi:hypothetical protein